MNTKQLINKYLVTAPTVLGLAVIANGVGIDSVKADDSIQIDSTLQQIQEYEKVPMGQVNSVGQLRDVSPTDWAYEALRSLVERYGCIVGYPDRTYRGNRALSRYEFAAGLNACMQQMERLIASSEAVLREDIETLKRLMKEFETELAMLGARVDNLESRVAFLEDHQFSTTTKLKGEVIIGLQASAGPEEKLDQFYRLPNSVNNDFLGISGDKLRGFGLNPDEFEDLNQDFADDLRDLEDAFDAGDLTEEEFEEAVADRADDYFDDVDSEIDDIDETDDQVTMSNRVRLSLDSSFTGRDRLRIRLAAGNVTDLGDAFGTDQARLNFQQSTDNDVVVDKAFYKTPIFGDFATFFIGTAMPAEDIYNTYSPYTGSSGTGSLARATRFNPFIYRAPGNAGVGLKFGGDFFDITASYLAGDANNPSEGAGLFDGSYSAGVQVGISPWDNLGFSIAYMRTYFNGSRDGVDVSSRANLSGSLGSDYTSGVSRSIALLGNQGGFRGARDPFSGAATTADNVGIQGSWTFGFMNISAWGGWSSATAQSHDSTGASRRGDWTELWTWNTNISFLDLLADGAVLTIGGGQLPRAGYVEGTFGRDKNQSWIVEGNYKFPVNDNISVTPGVYAVFNPNNDSENATIVVGVIRTVFKF